MTSQLFLAYLTILVLLIIIGKLVYDKNSENIENTDNQEYKNAQTSNFLQDDSQQSKNPRKII